MRRLALVVGGGGEEHRRQPVARRQRALHPARGRATVFVSCFRRAIVGRRVLQRPGRAPAGRRSRVPQLAMPNHRPRLKPGLKLRTALQLLAAGRGAPARVEPVAGPFSARCSRGQHARADGLVDALDLGHVDAAAGVADEQRARASPAAASTASRRRRWCARRRRGSRRPPAAACTLGWCLNCWNASNG